MHDFIIKANEYIEEEKMKILNDILDKVKEWYYETVKEFAFKHKGYKYFGLLMRTKRNWKIEYSEIYDFLRKDGEFLQWVENI